MGIHRESGLMEALHQNDPRRLVSNSRQIKELLIAVRNPAPVFFLYPFGHRNQMHRLAMA